MGEFRNARTSFTLIMLGVGEPRRPVTYLVICAGLILPAWLASYLPSRRVASVDPVEALCGE